MPRHPVRDVVVVVPGIGGSSLMRDGHLIWGGLGAVSALVDPEGALALSGNGFAPDPTVTPVGLLGCRPDMRVVARVGRLAQIPGLSRIGTYDRLVKELRAHFELDATNFVEFAYDWRLSCTVTAEQLRGRIWPVLEERRRRDPAARFVFICHSMGGLVVQQFTDVLEGGAYGQDTKEVITLGTPFLGAVTALGALASGVPHSVPILRGRFRRLAQTLPSMYELLPRYKAVIDGVELRTMGQEDLPDGAMGRELFERARAFHEALDTPTARPYARLVLVGSLQPTKQFAELHQGAVHLHRRWVHDQVVHDRRGDGTVPRQSVAPPEWADDSHAVPFAEAHIGLPSADSVLRVLQNVLTATPRAEQAEPRAQLAIEVPDLVAAGSDVEIGCEVVIGDRDVPLVVRIERVDGGAIPLVQSPRMRDGRLVASFHELPPADHMVTLQPATTMPDVRPVWDALTVVERQWAGAFPPP
jgi:hypothetical protein